MAQTYEQWKKSYESMNAKQQQQYNDLLKSKGSDYIGNQYMNQYNNSNTVYTPSTTQKVTNPNVKPTYTYGDTGGASNAQQYTGTGTSGGGNFQYSSSINTSKLPSSSMLFGNKAEQYESQNAGYLEKRNNAIANALYNEGKYDENSVRNYLNTFQDYRDYDEVGQNNTVTAIMKRMGGLINSQGNNQNTFGTGNNTDLNSRLQSEIWNNYNNAQKGYSDLMGGSSNYAQDFDTAVKNKLQQAFGISDLNEFRNRYPEYADSLNQYLESVRGVWDNTDPSQRQMLDGQLQGIIGSAVGAGSDTSKLKVLESSIMDKFQDPDRIKQDAQNVIKLQTEGKNTAEIASEMGIPEDQVQQLILLANGLDSKAGEYYQLKSEVAKDITEPYDTKMQRLEEEKKIALDRANRNVERLKQDFDTNLERQKQQNDINLHNADFISGQYGYGFSRRGIEGLNYVSTQAQQIIDDLTKNYDRNNQQMADGIADIIRNWQRNNDDLMKASQDALTNAKNAFTSNMLAIQQQYGTVGLQAQQALANNVQSFIEQAETIYDNALKRQQQNLTNLITNVSNLNALAAQNLTLRQAKIEQFQSESMNLNRNQLQNLANQLGMDTASYQDLVTYQAQAVANQLNGYLPGAGVQFQSQIQSLLDQGYTPTQAMQNIMNSADFKAMQQAATGSADKWSMSGGILYNQVTGEYTDLNGDEYGTIGDNLYNKRTGQIIQGAGGTAGSTSYVTSQTVDGQTYGVSQNTLQGLQNFYNNHQVGSTGGQCGAFVNDYLQSIGVGRIFTDPITDKQAQINTPKGYKGQIGDVIVMDSPSQPQYGHVAIITGVNADGTYTTLESNRKNNDGVVFSRTIDPNKTKVYGYYHPDGVSNGEDNSEAKQLAQAVANGNAQVPAKNSKIYPQFAIEFDKIYSQKYGGATPKGLDLINYSVKNDKELDSAAVEAIDGVFTSLYNAEYLIQTLEENKKKTGPLVSKLYKLNPRDADYASIKAQINSMSSKIARGFGEKGVLTDQDVERYMKAIPNEKLGNKANEVVGDLLQAKLYKGLMNTLEQYAKAGRDVHLWAEDYKMAQQWLQQHHFIDGGGRGTATAGESMGTGGGRM